MPLVNAGRYFRLIKDRPAEYRYMGKSPYELIVDENRIRKLAAQMNTPIGLLASSPWNLFVRDLVAMPNGEIRTFERVINSNANVGGCRGTVALIRCKNCWLLNRQFRHATRSTRGWEIESPRGYLDDGCTPEENIMREIAEETGLNVNSCTYLGDFIPDTGLSGGIVRAYLCEIDANGEDLSQRLPPHDGLQEGVGGYAFFDDAAFEEAIASGEIRDGMTLSAWALLKARENASMRGHDALVVPGEAEGDADAQ